MFDFPPTQQNKFILMIDKEKKVPVERGISQKKELQDPKVFLERKNKFYERLKQLVPVFLEVRRRMGLGENIGFGFLEQVHSGGDSLGSLPEIKKSKNGNIEYSVPASFIGQIKYANMLDAGKKNILIMPEFSENTRIVSIFDPYEEWNFEWSNLIDAPDDVFIGAIAHELVHTFDFSDKLPPQILEVLENRFREDHPDFEGDWEYKYGSEEEIDIAASLFGYKKQIIAKIDFVIDRLSKFGPHAKKDSAIKELQQRKQQVLKYCPANQD